MFCHNCGREAKSTSNYCTACGTRLMRDESAGRLRFVKILRALGATALCCALYFAVQYAVVFVWEVKYIAETFTFGVPIDIERITSALYEVFDYITIIVDAAVLFIVAIFFRIRRSSLSDSAGWRPAPPLRTLAAGVTGLALQFAVILVVAFLPIPESMMESHNDAMSAMTSAPVAIRLLSAAVAAPVFEETLFRGVIYQRWRGAVGVPLALVLSSAVFAVMHGDLISAVNAFVFGLLFGILYERFNSVAVSMALHAGFNAAAMLIPESIDSVLFFSLCFAAAGVAVVGFYLVFRRGSDAAATNNINN